MQPLWPLERLCFPPGCLQVGKYCFIPFNRCVDFLLELKYLKIDCFLKWYITTFNEHQEFLSELNKKSSKIQPISTTDCK